MGEDGVALPKRLITSLCKKCVIPLGGLNFGLREALGTAFQAKFPDAPPLLVLGALVFVSFDPNGLLSGYTTLPIQIFNWTGRPQEGFHQLAAATSVLLLVVLVAMNGVAILIRNRFQKRW